MLKEFLIITGTVFLMEFADKTQFSAIAFATKHNRVMVYFAVLLGLALATLVSVLVGKAFSFLPQKYLKIGAGIIFIIIGFLTILGK